MTNTTWSVAPSYTTDAGFRSWGLAISTALAAVGMTNTSDTGQINWTTVTRPVGANSDAGYEIWRFSDTAQSTAPVFIKLYYGSGGATANNPRIRVEVGTGSNGSGTLTGTGSGTITAVMTGSSSDATARANWMACDASGLVMSLANDSIVASNKLILVLDRMRDNTGAATTKGWMLLYAGATKGAEVINAVDSAVTTLAYWPAFVPFTVSGTTSFLDAGSNVITFLPYVACKQGVFASKMVVSYAVTDLAYDTQQAVNPVLGSSRTMRSLGANQTGLSHDAQASVTCAIWWHD